MYVNEVDGFKVGDWVVLNYPNNPHDKFIGDIAHLRYDEDQRKFYVEIEFGFGFLSILMAPGCLEHLPYKSNEIQRFPNDKNHIANTPIDLVYEWVKGGEWSLEDFNPWWTYVNENTHV